MKLKVNSLNHNLHCRMYEYSNKINLKMEKRKKKGLHFDLCWTIRKVHTFKQNKSNLIGKFIFHLSINFVMCNFKLLKCIKLVLDKFLKQGLYFKAVQLCAQGK